MCILWSTEYYLCGHTRPNQSRSKPCPQNVHCTRRNYIILQSNLQTCRVCWDAGDRRVNEPFARMLIRHAAESQERQQRKAERYFVREVLRRRQGLSGYVKASDPKRSTEKEAERDSREAGAERGGRSRARTGLGTPALPDGEIECDVESGGDRVEEGKDTENIEGEVDLKDEALDGGKRYECLSEIARPETPFIHWKLVRRHQPHYDDLPRLCDSVRLESMRKDYRARRGRSWE